MSAIPAGALAPPAAVAPCIVDIEASGFGRNSYAIEVGWVLPQGRSRCTLVRPMPGWTHWDPAAQRIHGLTREHLLAHGRDAVEVAQSMNHDLAGLTVYCDGWAHDYPWLAGLFDAAGLTPRFRLQHVRQLLTEAQAAALDGARHRIVADMKLTRHRASSDARALQLAVVQVLQGR